MGLQFCKLMGIYMTTTIETKPAFDLTPQTEGQRVAFARLQPYLPIDHTSYDDPAAETIGCIKVITGLNEGNAKQLEKTLRYCVEQIHYDIDAEALQQVRYQIYHDFNDELSSEAARFNHKGQLSKLTVALLILSEYMEFHIDKINRELAEFVIKVDNSGTMTLLCDNALDIYI